MRLPRFVYSYRGRSSRCVNETTVYEVKFKICDQVDV